MKIRNKKATFNYEIIEKYTAGIVLTGIEVKSIREQNVNLTDTFCHIKSGEVLVNNLLIPRYKNTHPTVIHDEKRPKKLLLKKEEIKKINKQIKDIGKTIIVLEILTVGNRIKLTIATAKGKNAFDKRNSIKDRDIKMDMKRGL